MRRATSIRLIPPALLLLLGSGCGHPVQRQLEGTWHGDSVENFGDRDLPKATGWAKGLRFSFSGARITVSVAAEEDRVGTFRVRSVRDSDVVLAVQRPDGKEDLTHLKLDSEHSIRWMLGESRSIVLRREL